ncbi:hypothetical protein GCM10023213_21620 [Prosthecobacter algae]|uniref:Uncharacterized protein n=1 Tax=Prosthecobacter algae TaxID=1144682 RepID=A0ABP9P2Y7_9BACT
MEELSGQPPADMGSYLLWLRSRGGRDEFSTSEDSENTEGVDDEEKPKSRGWGRTGAGIF